MLPLMQAALLVTLNLTAALSSENARQLIAASAKEAQAQAILLEAAQIAAEIESPACRTTAFEEIAVTLDYFAPAQLDVGFALKIAREIEPDKEFFGTLAGLVDTIARADPAAAAAFARGVTPPPYRDALLAQVDKAAALTPPPIAARAPLWNSNQAQARERLSAQMGSADLDAILLQTEEIQDQYERNFRKAALCPLFAENEPAKALRVARTIEVQPYNICRVNALCDIAKTLLIQAYQEKNSAVMN